MKTKPTFVVKYQCPNCGKKFTEVYVKGDKVQSGYGIYLRSHACAYEVNCPHCHTIECPNCEFDRVEILEKKEWQGEGRKNEINTT